MIKNLKITFCVNIFFLYFITKNKPYNNLFLLFLVIFKAKCIRNPCLKVTGCVSVCLISLSAESMLFTGKLLIVQEMFSIKKYHPEKKHHSHKKVLCDHN